MVHPVFSALAGRPELINRIAIRGILKSPMQTFSDLFLVLFPNEGNFSDELCSWLDLISNSFYFDIKTVTQFCRDVATMEQDGPPAPGHPLRMKRKAVQIFEKRNKLAQNKNIVLLLAYIKPEFMIQATPLAATSLQFWLNRLAKLFRRLGYPPEKYENNNIFMFVIYLVWVYRLLLRENYHRQDNIFNFMTSLPVHKTKVIILANRPVRNSLKSSGFAFQHSRSRSSRQLGKFMATEMSQVANIIGNLSHNVYWDEWNTFYNNGEFGGWTKQGVLLMNARQTPSKSKAIKDAWEIFNDFIIEQFNSSSRKIVFLLLGAKVLQKRQLINCSRHMVVNLYHPGRYHYEGLYEHADEYNCKYWLWERNLPFLNSNFFLYQRCGKDDASLIDWTSLSQRKRGRKARLDQLKLFFKTVMVIANWKLKNGRLFYKVKNNIIVERTHNGYLALRPLIMERAVVIE